MRRQVIGHVFGAISLVSAFCLTSLAASVVAPVTAPRPAVERRPLAVTVEPLDGRPIVHVDGKPFFPLGVTYHFTRHRDDWDRDLRLMRQIGLNTVRVDFAWRDVVPFFAKQYHFAVLDAFLDAAYRHGLKVVPVFSYATGDVNIPLWFAAQHRGWPTVRDDGAWILSAQPSLSHPDYRRLLGEFIRRTVAHIRDHPALLAYQILNEPHYHPEYLADYNAHTIAAFRAWLAEQYETIAALNQRWLLEHASFADVLPPGRAFAQPPAGGSEPAWRDWREFSYENLAGFVEKLGDTIRAEDPKRPTIVAEMSWWWWGQQPHTGVSPWHIYRAADVIGYDVYPEEPSHALYYALNSDMLARYWQKPVWVMELNRKDGRPTAADVQAFAREAVSHGATGIFYFQWQDDWRDGGAYGLLDGWGRPKEQFHAFANAVAWLREHQENLLASRPPEPDVFILWPTEAIAHTTGQDSPALKVFQAAAHAVLEGLRVGIVEERRLAALGPEVKVIEVPR